VTAKKLSLKSLRLEKVLVSAAATPDSVLPSGDGPAALCSRSCCDLEATGFGDATVSAVLESTPMTPWGNARGEE